ncbi:uncharacterized protein LOC128987591 [Macrosteles quadrilineatus]|uniref:uncharacterized protein LOC128987591 n=1 Tax=Macrosteles quadrilineatus TaxID=74068 RepID=UPI0023E1788C|nr:uncharacterized protein LOC128987591 [Macrosteles quadrilineatus]
MSSILAFGFNKFQQLNCLQLLLLSLQEQEISDHYCSRECSSARPFNKVFNLKLDYCESPYMIRNEYPQVNSQFLFSWSYCLVIIDNTLFLCGFLGGISNSSKSLKTPNGKTICQASCNRRQVLCVTEDGCCWQYNVETDLWKDLTNILLSDVDICDEDTSPVIITKVCCGELVTAILTSKGEVFNWPNKLTLPSVKVKDIACGRAHIILLSDNGQVFSVGEGSRGQLGHGELEAEEEPRLVEGLAGLTVVAVACGGWHSCAVTADGDLYTWGWNMSGQLGLQTSKAGSGVSVQALPVAVEYPHNEDIKVISAACGARHTVSLTEGGGVWVCGWNGYGQLFLPDVDCVDQMTQIVVPDNLPVRQILCGPWNSCLITQS